MDVTHGAITAAISANVLCTPYNLNHAPVYSMLSFKAIYVHLIFYYRYVLLLVHAGLFECFHNPPNSESDMECGLHDP